MSTEPQSLKEPTPPTSFPDVAEDEADDNIFVSCTITDEAQVMFSATASIPRSVDRRNIVVIWRQALLAASLLHGPLLGEEMDKLLTGRTTSKWVNIMPENLRTERGSEN